MSLAGPYGEAACRYCRQLQDLNEERRLVVHSVGGNRARCQGSGTYAHSAEEREMPELAFHSDPVQRHCPHCGQLVVINTIGASSRSGWRFQYHKLPQLKAAKSWGQPPSDCPESGHLVHPYGYDEVAHEEIRPHIVGPSDQPF